MFFVNKFLFLFQIFCFCKISKKAQLENDYDNVLPNAMSSSSVDNQDSGEKFQINKKTSSSTVVSVSSSVMSEGSHADSSRFKVGRKMSDMFYTARKTLGSFLIKSDH